MTVNTKIKSGIQLLSLLLAGVLACAPAIAAPEERIQHIIVIILENHSFDNLFGDFPGAEGRAQAGPTVTQSDKFGTPYPMLPSVPDDDRIPSDLPNQPFPIERYIPASDHTPDLVHRFYQEQEQIDGGRMDRFAAWSGVGGMTMGYFDGNKTALWQYAKKYTLADHFFHGAFGGSFLNHFWLICACTPRFENAPDEMKIVLDASGHMVKDERVTPDGYAVNLTYPAYHPHSPKHSAKHRLPPQTMPTIGDRLSEKNISWAWYSGGWKDALAGNAAPTFQYHHQPFVYFKNFGDGTQAKTEHLKDEMDFIAALKSGKMPSVAFLKPLGEFNLHPGYTDLVSGDTYIDAVLTAIEHSSIWPNTVVVVTFDENGGYWDHVPPPKGDRWGPGVRVPTLIVSPFARKGYVDHTVYDTTSILKMIEKRFDLAPLSERDERANDLTNALAFP